MHHINCNPEQRWRRFNSAFLISVISHFYTSRTEKLLPQYITFVGPPSIWFNVLIMYRDKNVTWNKAVLEERRGCPATNSLREYMNTNCWNIGRLLLWSRLWSFELWHRRSSRTEEYFDAIFRIWRQHVSPKRRGAPTWTQSEISPKWKL
jgi:hypothetical protein